MRTRQLMTTAALATAVGATTLGTAAGTQAVGSGNEAGEPVVRGISRPLSSALDGPCRDQGPWLRRHRTLIRPAAKGQARDQAMDAEGRRTW